MARILLIAVLLLPLTGCRISPLSPELNNKIDNQNGKIEDIRNNQNGLMLELLKLRNEQTVTARDVENLQQGVFNTSNSGIQILQGDGAILAVIVIVGMLLLFIYHYRSLAVKNQKVAEIFAQQIAVQDNLELNNNVFMSAMYTDVEEDVYKLVVNSQNRRGRKPI